MNIKHRKLLFVAGIINILLGGFYMICGLLEFSNIIKTAAHTYVETISIQLSYLVFISSLLTVAVGIITVIYNKKLHLLNLRVFMGTASLAWPLFLSITLFFTKLQINIRLTTMTLSALFYVIAVLIVKITNTEFSKGVKFNPSAVIAQSGRRAKSVNISAAMNSTTGKFQSKNIAHTVENIASTIKPRKVSGINFNRLFKGKRIRSNEGMFKMFYSGRKRKSKNVLAGLLGNKRRRSRFRLR